MWFKVGCGKLVLKFRKNNVENWNICKVFYVGFYWVYFCYNGDIRKI